MKFIIVILALSAIRSHYGLVSDNVHQVTSGTGWPPFIQWDSQRNVLIGIAPGIMDAASRQFGYQYTNKNLGVDAGNVAPEEYLKKASKSEIAECGNMVDPSWRQDFANDLIWTDTVIETSEWLFFHPGKAPKGITDITKLPKGTKIGVCKDYIFPALDPLFKSGQLERVDFQHGKNSCDFESIEGLRRKEVEAVNVNVHVVGYFLKQKALSRKDLERSEIRTSSTSLKISCAKNKPSEIFVQKFNEALKVLNRKNLINQIISKYSENI